jgi:hypothetical protein
VSLNGGSAHAIPEDLDGMACLDLETGVLLALSTRDERSFASLELAALAAAQLCAAPRLETLFDEGATAREALVVSETSVHAFALSKRCPGRIVIAVAPGDTNVALLLASVRSVAESLAD